MSDLDAINRRYENARSEADQRYETACAESHRRYEEGVAASKARYRSGTVVTVLGFICMTAILAVAVMGLG